METTAKSMETTNAYNDFTKCLKSLISEHPALITTTLSNIFTMRLIGNKTHGDLAEIAISEFIDQYMENFESTHVGRHSFRDPNSQEEDIKIKNKVTKVKFSVSLKAYKYGPLQLSTNKDSSMFSRLEGEEKKEGKITDREQIRNLLEDSAFSDFGKINVLPLIYDQESKPYRCNILIFDYNRARRSVSQIIRIGEGGRRNRKHPVYRFYDSEGDYICEVRYGGGNNNALQRGLWTDTKKVRKFFDSITNGWIVYSDNQLLRSLFSRALVSSKAGHKAALEEIRKDILNLKQNSGMG